MPESPATRMRHTGSRREAPAQRSACLRPCARAAGERFDASELERLAQGAAMNEDEDPAGP